MLFDLLERLVITTDSRAVAEKIIRGDEEYLRDHYPGYPLVPGIVVLDAIAQSGAFLVHTVMSERRGQHVLPVLTMVESAMFLRTVRPGDRLRVTTELVTTGTGATLVDGVADVDGRAVAKARTVYALVEMTQQMMGLDASQVKTLRQYWDQMRVRVRQKRDLGADHETPSVS